MIGQTLEFVATESSGLGPDLRCAIEGEPAATSASASLADVAAMLTRAQSGRSAWTYLLDRCSVAQFSEDGALRVTLACYVWPSRPDLAYTLTLPDGAIPGPISLIQDERQWRFWISGRGVLTLPWRLEGARFEWFPGYPCVDAFCQPVAPPAIHHEHARITVSAEQDVYGLLTAFGLACGFRHEFTVAFGKLDAEGSPQKIEAESLPVSVAWLDAEGEQQRAEAEVEIPQCARDLLSTCDNGQAIASITVKHGGGGTVEVAYNTCTGEVLAVRRRQANP